ncbi:MAG: phosphodiester glycosidase family protein [Lachnospiraceae bacterium]|jgi:exopolysaccharide biosynthesis protein|nr:phosphodiester glycosidase family protein [Lachnospiraceae bacterium]MCI1328414.1 phosphodiester glycosidase family protein [Lachnospiraceae bacterium]
MSGRKKKGNRKNRWKGTAAVILAAYTAFTMLSTFVIPNHTVTMAEAQQSLSAQTQESSASAETSPESENTASGSGSADSGSGSADSESGSADSGADSTASESAGTDAVITENSYTSDDLTITITEKTVDNTQVYIADIQTEDPSLLLAGLADDTFGRNVSATTSSIAESCGAILAINGDYYGFRDTGYVMRNGYLYRDTASGDADQEDLVIYEDGTMDVVKESDVTAEELEENGAVQIYSFGPGLVEDGEIAVDENDEVGKSMTSNPRTAIGMISEGHYVMVVSDGRTEESEGLTLEQLAGVMQELGCTVAYNLDGGGSSTMYFNGEVVNKPTTNGSISERKVSDIVYIAES